MSIWLILGHCVGLLITALSIFIMVKVNRVLGLVMFIGLYGGAILLLKP